MTIMPFVLPFDLATLSENGADVKLAPTEAERKQIANWLGVNAVENLAGLVRLSRHAKDSYGYEASFEADVVQACVVTLEPVPAHLSGAFQRAFQVVSRNAPKRRDRGPGSEKSTGPFAEPSGGGGEISLSEADDPDVLDSSMLDLAGPLLEELSLALDPYPRAPGAKFEVPAVGDPPAESPFAVLQGLKDKTGKEAKRAPARPKRKS